MPMSKKVPESAEVRSGAYLQAELVICEAVARAAETLVDIMDNSPSDSLRLQAAKHIMSLAKGESKPVAKEQTIDEYRNSITRS
jgi:hypothetical protein